jgi:hypothetical protein
MELSRVAFNKRILISVLSFVLLISFNSIVYGQWPSISLASVGLDEQPYNIHVTSAVGGWGAVDDAPIIGTDRCDPAKAGPSTSQEQTAMAEQLAIKIRSLIQGISVSNEQPVLGPWGNSINNCGDDCHLSSLSDEHSTIFPPRTFKHHPQDYLFFAAPGGVIVLTGGKGPSEQGQWTLDYASDYGLWWPNNPLWSRNGAVFRKPGAHLQCPRVTDATQQDPTFDLNYALPGSLVIDPTVKKNAEPGNLLMIYEGTNRCMGTKGPHQTGGVYSTVGIATSDDEGHTWPAYVIGFSPLNQDEPEDPYIGPRAPEARGEARSVKGA